MKKVEKSGSKKDEDTLLLVSNLSFVKSMMYNCKNYLEYVEENVQWCITAVSEGYYSGHKYLPGNTSSAVNFFNQIAEKLPSVIEGLDKYAKKEKSAQASVLKKELLEDMARQSQDFKVMAEKVQKLTGAIIPSVIVIESQVSSGSGKKDTAETKEKVENVYSGPAR